MKKAPQVALLEDRKENGDEGILPEKRGFWRRKAQVEGQGSGFKNAFLAFLEKFTRKLRVFFLKLENLFTHWSENIKRKRKGNIKIESKMSNDGNVEISNIGGTQGSGRTEIASKEKKQEFGKSVYVRNFGDMQRKIWGKNIDEKTIRPIISEKVVVPRIKPEIKNRLERILIERIASNPKDTEAYERLGEYYFEIENYEHSKECFKQVVKLDTMNVNAKDKMKKLERLLSRR